MDNNEIFNELSKELKVSKLFINEPMSKHTSFKIGGIADIFIKICKIEELKYILKFAKKYEIPVTVIGNGTNLLVLDEGIRGITLQIAFDEIEIDTDGIINVGSGVPIMKLARIALDNSLSGIEFAAGIPGNVSGAVKMNAGAYNFEIKDVIVSTKYMDREGNVFTIQNEEHKFKYRYSKFFDTDDIILETKIKLVKADKDLIKAKMDGYNSLRNTKQPIGTFNAGSIFKRGEDFIAPKLIEEAGLKGFCIGDAEISQIHSGFIVNKGNATAKDVLKLIEHIKKVILEKFNKKLELEIIIVGGNH